MCFRCHNYHGSLYTGALEAAGYDVTPAKISRREVCEIFEGKTKLWSCHLPDLLDGKSVFAIWPS